MIAYGASGNPVTFASQTTGVCTVSGSTVTLVAAGTCTIAADQLGNASYNAAAQVAQSFAVNKVSQTIGTISFNPTSLTVGNTTTASATATSGLGVTFSSTTQSICTVSGTTVTGVAAGTCTIAGDQTGNGTYSAAQQVTQNITVTAGQSTRLVNISTRGQVGIGDNVMIGGFIIQGSAPKTVLIRAGGPSMANSIPGVLANPVLELHDSSGAVIATNDDWGNASNATAIQASQLAPSNPLESAILTTLNPGAYTAIVSGKGGGIGVGIVEVYEVDHPEYQLINISTRGQVGTGDNVMIGGFIIQGSAPKTVLIRAGGPSMANSIPGVLANPVLELHDSSGAVIATNDDWGNASNATAIQASQLAPSNTLESAILTTLNPGAYTVFLSGVNGGTGVAIIEVYAQ